MKIKEVAKVAVIKNDGQILLLRRSPTDTRRPGEWDFPGGRVDPGETPLQAAVRELQEEAGMSVLPDSLALLYVGTEFEDSKTNNVHRYLYLTRLDDAPDIILSFEHDDCKWVSLEQALIDFPHPFYRAGIQYGIDHAILN